MEDFSLWKRWTPLQFLLPYWKIPLMDKVLHQKTCGPIPETNKKYLHNTYDLRSPPKLTLPTLKMDSLSTMCTLNAAYIQLGRQIHNDARLSNMMEYELRLWTLPFTNGTHFPKSETSNSLINALYFGCSSADNRGGRAFGGVLGFLRLVWE